MIKTQNLSAMLISRSGKKLGRVSINSDLDTCPEERNAYTLKHTSDSAGNKVFYQWKDLEKSLN